MAFSKGWVDGTSVFVDNAPGGQICEKVSQVSRPGLQRVELNRESECIPRRFCLTAVLRGLRG
jgi:hypothetical protein